MKLHRGSSLFARAAARRAQPLSTMPAFLLGLAGVILSITSSFMMVTPICTLGVPLLPTFFTGSMLGSTARDLRVSISRSGYTRVGDSLTAPSELQTTLERELTRHEYERITVEADVRVPYGALTPVFRAARAQRVPVVLLSAPTSVATQSAPT